MYLMYVLCMYACMYAPYMRCMYVCIPSMYANKTLVYVRRYVCMYVYITPKYDE